MKTCELCRGPANQDDCYVRLRSEDRPACRPCWEQLFLDPRRLLRSLQSSPSESAHSRFPSN